ncbi:glycosyltransferase family 39 protein [Candidatus Woesearchaeota archaeon]|nr:glycosyltransferase family 39 protein [Candidatus Woesearchaeota archaeon]
MLFLDNPTHLSMYKYYIEEIILKQHFIFGFNPSDFAGMPIGSIYSQIGFFLLTIMNLVFNIPLELSYKILVFLAYLTPSLLLYFLCSKYFDKMPSLAISLLYLIIWKDVILTIFGGMWTYYIGISFLLIFLYFLIKFYTKHSIKYVLILSVLFSLIILSHPFATFAAICLMGSFFLANFIIRRVCVKKTTVGLMVVFFLAFLTTAIYTLPLAIDLSSWLRSYAWGLGLNYFQILYRLVLPLAFAVPQNLMLNDLINPLRNQEYLLLLKNLWQFFVASFPQLIILLFSVIGVRNYIKNRKENSEKIFFLTVIGIFSITTFIISSGFWHLNSFLHNLPIISGLISHRFQIYTEIGMLIFAAYGITELWNKRTSSFIHEKRNILAIIFVLFILINFSSYYPQNKIVKTSESSEMFKEEVLPLWSWIEKNVDEKETRILYQSFWKNTDSEYDSDSIHAMSVHYTNVNFIGGWTGGTPNPTEFTLTSTKGNRLLGKTIETISDEEVVTRLKMLNVKYVVVIEPKLKNKLESSKNFKKEYSIGRFEVYSLKDYNPEWFDFKYETEYTINTFESQNIDITIKDAKKDNKVLVKLAKNPYWHAYLNNKEIEIKNNGLGLMEIEVKEAGNLRLVYDPIRKPYILLTFIGIIILVVLSTYTLICRNKPI